MERKQAARINRQEQDPLSGHDPQYIKQIKGNVEIPNPAKQID